VAAALRPRARPRPVGAAVFAAAGAGVWGAVRHHVLFAAPPSPARRALTDRRARRPAVARPTTSQFVSASFDADIFPEFSARSPPTCLENNHPQRCIQCHQTFGRTTIQRTAQYIPLLYKSVQ